MLATSNSVLQCLFSSKTTSHANRGHLLMRFIASQARDAQRGLCTLVYGSHVTVSNPVSPLLLSMLQPSFCTLNLFSSYSNRLRMQTDLAETQRLTRSLGAMASSSLFCSYGGHLVCFFMKVCFPTFASDLVSFTIPRGQRR